jgi:hypothetical protein
MPFIDAGLFIAVFAALLWVTLSLLGGSRTQRKEEVRLRKISHQPWDDDKVGGRGNR